MMSWGDVNNSQAILARFLSPPDKPVRNASPISNSVHRYRPRYRKLYFEKEEEDRGGGGGREEEEEEEEEEQQQQQTITITVTITIWIARLYSAVQGSLTMYKKYFRL